MQIGKKTRVKYWGHAFFSLEEEEQLVVIDPYQPSGRIPQNFYPRLILVSHGHSDHLGEAVELSRRTHSPIIAIFELANYCESQGATVIGAHFGGKIAMPFGWVKLVPAFHSSSGPKGIFLGNPAGFLIQFFGRLFYHAGDTSLFSDMALFKKEGKICCALIPIGGHYTMGPEDAVEAVKLLEPDVVIPMHYGTFPLIEQDPRLFADLIGKNTSSRCLIMRPGEEVEL